MDVSTHQTETTKFCWQICTENSDSFLRLNRSLRCYCVLSRKHTLISFLLLLSVQFSQNWTTMLISAPLRRRRRQRSGLLAELVRDTPHNVLERNTIRPRARALKQMHSAPSFVIAALLEAAQSGVAEPHSAGGITCWR